MKQQTCRAMAAILMLALFASAPLAQAMAESEVLESNVEAISVGAKIGDETRVVIPEDGRLRVLIVSSGTTKTLQGPYEGTIPNYKEERSWWERITGRGKDSDAPIGATRGLVRPPEQPQQ